jgi:hypothetical protein
MRKLNVRKSLRNGAMARTASQSTYLGMFDNIDARLLIHTSRQVYNPPFVKSLVYRDKRVRHLWRPTGYVERV